MNFDTNGIPLFLALYYWPLIFINAIITTNQIEPFYLSIFKFVVLKVASTNYLILYHCTDDKLHLYDMNNHNIIMTGGLRVISPFFLIWMKSQISD